MATFMTEVSSVIRNCPAANVASTTVAPPARGLVSGTLRVYGGARAAHASYDPSVVLSDRTIKRLVEDGRIGIDPYDEALMQPSSLDVRVDRYFRVFRNSRYPFIDVKQAQEELTELVEVDGEEAFILHPGEFVLGSTLERVTLPDDLVARLEGKSSLGRLGLLIHSTAGFIDPGWDGHVTLELSNVANLPITIYPEMKIGQLSFVQLSEPAETPYGSGELGSKYQGQQGPTPSRYYRNFEPDGG
jgi:dCTP deaminase